MAKIKILVGKNETIESAEDMLFKAMDMHRTGEIHKEEFHDPAMRDLSQQIEAKHREMFKDLLEEVLNVIDSEYTNGYE